MTSAKDEILLRARGSRFQIDFGVAKVGWLPITLYFDDATLEYFASGVLNDPVTELADAALAISGNDGVEQTVRIWEEPATTEIRFVSEPGSAHVTVAVYDRDLGRNLHEKILERAHVRESILISLTGLEEKVSRSGTLLEWGDFPTKQMRELLRGRSVPDPRDAPIQKPWELAPNSPRIVEELLTEVGPRHVLYGISATLVAVDTDSDRYLFELQTGPDQYVVVRLTWSGSTESDAHLPETVFFRDWDAWVSDCMMPDHRRRDSRSDDAESELSTR